MNRIKYFSVALMALLASSVATANGDFPTFGDLCSSQVITVSGADQGTPCEDGGVWLTGDVYLVQYDAVFSEPAIFQCVESSRQWIADWQHCAVLPDDSVVPEVLDPVCAL